MELMYRARAKADPKNSKKWLGQAQRWGQLARETLARAQSTDQQQMHNGPMQMGPNTIKGDLRGKQQE